VAPRSHSRPDGGHAPTMPQGPYPRNSFVYDANAPQGDQPSLVAGFIQRGRTTGEEVCFCLGLCFAQPTSSGRVSIAEHDGDATSARQHDREPWNLLRYYRSFSAAASFLKYRRPACFLCLLRLQPGQLDQEIFPGKSRCRFCCLVGGSRRDQVCRISGA